MTTSNTEGAMNTIATIPVLVIPVDDNEPVRVEQVDPTDHRWMTTLLNLSCPGAVWGHDWTAWCDDNGMMLRLPVNFRASRLFGYLGHPPAVAFGGTMTVLGPVAFAGADFNDDGDSTGVADDVLRVVKELRWLTA